MSSENSPLADVGVGDEGGGSAIREREPSSSPRSSPVNGEAANEAAANATASTMVLSSLADELNSLGGFDLCHPFHTSWYNSLLADEGLLGDGEDGTLCPLPEEDDGARSPRFDSSSSSSAASALASACAAGDADAGGSSDASTFGCNAVLIGNTRRMWPRFIDWLRERKDDGGAAAFDALLSDDPLDSFVTEIIGDVVSRHAQHRFRPRNGGRLGVVDLEQRVEVTTLSARTGEHDQDESKPGTTRHRNDAPLSKNYEIFWSHDTTPRRLVSMQRVAEAAGCCYFDREFTMLSVHPTYGPWLAFRAVVVICDVDLDVGVMGGLRDGTALRSVPRPSPPRRARPPPPRPPTVECLLTEDERAEAAKISLQSPALSSGTGGGGRDLREILLCGADARGKSESDVVSLDDVHVALIARRDCIGLGREEGYRYSEGQILYHYTKNRRVLLREMMSSSGSGTCT